MPERPVADAPAERPDLPPSADLDRSTAHAADEALRRAGDRLICDLAARLRPTTTGDDPTRGGSMATDYRPASDEAGTPADAPAAGDHAARLAALRRLDGICRRACDQAAANRAARAATSDDPRAGATSGQDPASSAE